MSRTRLALVFALIMAFASVGPAAAATPPANDTVAGATTLQLDTPLEFDSSAATSDPGDPTTCEGSHGSFPGPYAASVWFRYTATRDGQLHLSSPTMQGEESDFLAITFVYRQTSSGLELVDCTAYGNDASWPAVKGATYLIMEAGLPASTTEEPEFSDRGGHGTIWLSRTANERQYAWFTRFTYADCGFRVNVEGQGGGVFRLKPGDPTPYVFDRFHFSFVTTNPANGKWFRESGGGLYRDVEITNVSGTIYTFVARESGRPFTLTDMHGNRIYHDRGRVLITFQVDTKGDADLRNDEFIDGSWAILSEKGRHDRFHIEDWCADVVQPLLG